MNATEYVKHGALAAMFNVCSLLSDWLLKYVNSSKEYSQIEEFVKYSFNKNIWSII